MNDGWGSSTKSRTKNRRHSIPPSWRYSPNGRSHHHRVGTNPLTHYRGEDGGCPEYAELEGGRVRLSPGRNAETRPPRSHPFCFHDTLVNVWKAGHVSQQWKDEAINVLHKNTDRSDCNNHRGISIVVFHLLYFTCCISPVVFHLLYFTCCPCRQGTV